MCLENPSPLKLLCSTTALNDHQGVPNSSWPASEKFTHTDRAGEVPSGLLSKLEYKEGECRQDPLLASLQAPMLRTHRLQPGENMREPGKLDWPDSPSSTDSCSLRCAQGLGHYEAHLTLGRANSPMLLLSAEGSHHGHGFISNRGPQGHASKSLQPAPISLT